MTDGRVDGRADVDPSRDPSREMAFLLFAPQSREMRGARRERRASAYTSSASTTSQTAT